jgi:lysophospholipase L1-like esterase
MNSKLKSLASSGRVVIVPWAEQAAANPSWMAGDGVHATPTGYRERAQMYANAAKQCG